MKDTTDLNEIKWAIKVAKFIFYCVWGFNRRQNFIVCTVIQLTVFIGCTCIGIMEQPTVPLTHLQLSQGFTSTCPYLRRLVF